MSQHAAHPFLNLREGTMVGTVSFDFYWGSSSHNTHLRNAVDRKNPRLDGGPMSRNLHAFRIDKFSLFNNALGNVLGHEGMKGEYEAVGRSPLTEPTGWILGIPDDPKVAETLLRHGNYDWVTRQTRWDPAIPSRKLPDSLYLAAKPAWFGKLAWPPIGPDRKPMVGTIPARERWLKIPAAEREAQDLLYLSEFQLAAGNREGARKAFQQVHDAYGKSASARAAKANLETMK